MYLAFLAPRAAGGAFSHTSSKLTGGVDGTRQADYRKDERQGSQVGDDY
jgi:hypothetical protein